MNKLFVVILIFIFSSFACGQLPEYSNGAISSANELATKAGIDVLQKGGNAIDAAVAVGFVLAVVYPQAGNIGGGGFMVIHLSSGLNTSIDYREKAPSNAQRNMYLDNSGNVIPGLSTTGNLAAGVPGSVAGMLYALEKYGTKSIYEILGYSVNIADTGFYINKQLADNLNAYSNEFSMFEGTRKIFGKNFNEGELLVQKDLANTLKEIRDNGVKGFYEGRIADIIVSEMIKTGGIINHDDLRNYRPVEREPITGTYRNFQIYSMGPPSSGGISLIYLLNILENYDLKKYGYGSTKSIHLMTEAMRRVYADRSEFMGDADFVNVPADILTSKVYAQRRMEDYSENIATPSSMVSPGDAYYKESDQTTHYSVADKNGNIVSVTTTINDLFGNKAVVDGAGFFLNNEMDDFVSKPGVPNIYGLVGSEANSIEPGKRMLSSMTPTIIFKNNKPFLVLGSPGGGRIITAVLQTIINIIDHEMTLDAAIDISRFHHQWLPDEIQTEKGFPVNDVKEELVKMGYKIKELNNFGRIDAVIFNKNGSMSAYSDSRGSGKALGF
ncbi:MAG: Glutathione hydrolase proenzyme [Ignavibacteria bacterium]|nr:Glutathione hydrolase proenzyme [Ignavibacteria bacterium]